MDKILILPLLASVFMVQHYDPRRLFVSMYLPSLLLVPIYYETEFVPSTPEFNFASAIFFPIFVAWLLKSRGRGYRFYWPDAIIFAYILLVFLNQWVNSDYKVAQKVLFNDLMARLGPYVMVRAVFNDVDLRRQLFRNIVLVGAFISFVNLYEFRLWTNLFDLPWRKIWPEWVPWDGSMKRGGFKRVAGPFAHPICNGYFFALSAPIAAYLQRRGELLRNKGMGRWIGRGIVVLHALGVITSLSRAPIFGLFMGFGLLAFGWSKRKIIWIIACVPVAIIALAITIPMFLQYLSVDREHAQDESQRNAAYRRELIDNYLAIVDERPLVGWGRFTVPWIDNQVSIDNEYLYTALVSGKLVMYLYLAAILAAVGRTLNILRSRLPGPDPGASEQRRLLGWVIIAGLLAGALTQATVYAGTQTVQMFFMFLAMAAGLSSAPFGSPLEEVSIPPERRYGYAHRFSRTL